MIIERINDLLRTIDRLEKPLTAWGSDQCFCGTLGLAPVYTGDGPSSFALCLASYLDIDDEQAAVLAYRHGLVFAKGDRGGPGMFNLPLDKQKLVMKAAITSLIETGEAKWEC